MMEVSSPIGELPFEIKSVSVTRRGINAEGAMGAWPTSVSATWPDLVVIVRRTGSPLVPALAIAGAVGVTISLLRRRRTS
jgi:hypothetical protein